MVGRTKKSTKKFEKNHLKETIDKRKESAKIKQRQQIKAKKQARHATDYTKAPDNDLAEKPQTKGDAAAQALSKMSVDEFFQGGFDLPEKAKGKAKRRDARPQQAIGKRKRDTDGGSVDPKDNNASSGDEAASEMEDNLKAHKEELEALAEKDPEFYKYLKENDAELLDFDENVNLAEVDGLSEEESPKINVMKGKLEDKHDTQEDQSTVTMAMVQRWKTAMLEQHSLRAMRQAVLAFRAAAHINSDDDKEHKYAVSNPEVYHEVLITTLEHLPTVLNHHLPIKESPPGKIRIATDSKKYRTLSPLLKSHTASILRLLSTLSDGPTIKITLSSLTPLLPYLLSFKKLLKVFIKTVVSIWSTPASTDEATLITAFLVLRRLALISDPSIREAVLKQTYQGLVKGARITNVHTLSSINLMKNSCTELWGIDTTTGYTTGFTYIRQLAVHLRGSITRPTKESYKIIYNWQYVHSLDFWSRVLTAHCSPTSNVLLKKPQDSPLHPLIYPLVQITLGALRLIPTPTYFPLRFHLIRSLLRISRTTDTYIPLAPALLEVLDSPELSKPPKPSTLPPLDFRVVLRGPKSYLRTRIYQDGVGHQVQELLAEFFGCWAKSIAFPELIIPPSVMLKRWLKSASSTPQRGDAASKVPANRQGKGNKNAKVNALIALLLQKMSANAEFVEKHRRSVTFGPGDREQVDNFLRDVPLDDTPLGAFVAGLRKQNEERERVLEAGRRTDEEKKQEAREEKDEELRQSLRKIEREDEGEEEVDDEMGMEEDEVEESEEEVEDEVEMEEDGIEVSEDDE
ncbi:MAG: hypothetical protein Q9163_004404 [Psora crenata]